MSLVGRSIGNYVVERQLGEGGMGVVYVARHPRLGKRVAVKVLKADLQRDEDAVGRFFQEAKAVAELHHANIVEVLDFGTIDGVAYFTMPLLEGEDLASRINTTGLTIEEARRILIQCCSALGACHAQGIVHRDLKPENVFLVGRPGEGMKVKLLDFGLAKLTRTEGKVVKTLTGEIFGTPLYTSPEQAAGGSKDVGPAADIYSLGVILYELWTGQVPFPGDTVTAIFVGHLTQAPRSPTDWNPHLSRAHAAVLLKTLAKQPGDRYRTADELAEALARLGPARKPDEPGAAAAQVRAARTLLIRRATPVPIRVPRFSRRQQRTFGWGAAAGAAILLLGIALGAALRTPSSPVASGESIPAVTPSPSAAVPARVLIQIASIPAEATVLRAGKQLGLTPMTLEPLPSEPPFEITVTLAHHEPARVLVDPTKSARHMLALVRVKALKPAGTRRHGAKRPGPSHTEDDLLKSEFR